MMLTLFSDASYCPKTRAAGWGAWAKRDDWPRGRFTGGPIRQLRLSSSTSAELLGITEALYFFYTEGAFEGIEAIMIQCDNIGSLGAVRRAIPRASFKAGSGIRDVQQLHSQPFLDGKLNNTALRHITSVTNGKTVWLRHVKGHQSGDGRNWVNEQCDAEARRHMLTVRKEREAVRHFEAAE